MGDVADLNFQVRLALAAGVALLAAAVLAAAIYCLGSLHDSHALFLAPPAVGTELALAPAASAAADGRRNASPADLRGTPDVQTYEGGNLDSGPYAPPVVAALVAVLSTPDPPPQSEGSGPDDQVQFTPNKEDLPDPNLGSHLNGLVAGVEAGQATAQAAARGAAIHQGESMKPTVHLSGRADAVNRLLEDKG